MIEQISPLLFTALVGAVAIQRLAELRLSARNSRAAVVAGAVEVGGAHYPWMVALHTAFLISSPLEVWLLERQIVPPLAAAMTALLVAATILRYTAIRALRERWTTRAFRWPDGRRIRTGPYRFFRHPNYLAVRLEILALPLLHSAWVTALVFTGLNTWLLGLRIRAEEPGLTDMTTTATAPIDV